MSEDHDYGVYEKDVYMKKTAERLEALGAGKLVY